MANRALLVGIDKYEVPGNQLNSCVKDSYAVRDLLEQLEFSDGDSEINMLHDEEATLANIRDGLDWLLSDVQPGDRCVFYQSSHGYRDRRDGGYVEVLVCHDRDQFLEDTELVERSRQVPPGTLTVVLDACHSGGMNKDYFDPQQRFRTTRAKVFVPPYESVKAQAKELVGGKAPTLKLFGRVPARSKTKLFSGSGPGRKGVKARAEVEVNAVLLTACAARETAAAGSEDTDGLSAFTYALLQQMDAASTVSELIERTADSLDELEMEQTPGCFAPQDQQFRLSEAFLSEPPATESEISGWVEDFIASLMSGESGNPLGRKSQPAKSRKETATMTVTTTQVERAVEKVIKPIIEAATGTPSKKPGGKPKTGYQTGGAGTTAQRDVLAYATMLTPAFAAASKAVGVKPKAPRLVSNKSLTDEDWWPQVLDTSWTMTNCFPQLYWDLYPEELTKGATEDVAARIARKVPRKLIDNPDFWEAVVTSLTHLAPVIIEMVTDGEASDKAAHLPKDIFGDIFDAVDDIADFAGDVLPTVFELAPYVLALV
ncbi:caspase domain-containing protein [Streptomyces sp. TLI_55]|uniref:caspase family protein n=1 Tax=Streptomyces sp. TLI_55 TaxID=1938861 RepID=UPI000BC53088|nr:caspase family protein [Streptomyces sp. TLI_55]SNX88626.1 caspase domain-containing protein [Streptomyces sp. TLI_55]